MTALRSHYIHWGFGESFLIDQGAGSRYLGIKIWGNCLSTGVQLRLKLAAKTMKKTPLHLLGKDHERYRKDNCFTKLIVGVLSGEKSQNQAHTHPYCMKVIYMEFKKKLKKLGVQFWICHVSISPVQGKTIRLFIFWILQLSDLFTAKKKVSLMIFVLFSFRKYVHFWDVWFFNRLGSHWWGLDKDKKGINKHLLLSPISFLYAGLKPVFSCVGGSLVDRVRGAAVLKN